jgi:hypothetical protein
MRKFALAFLVLSVVGLGVASQALAFEGGGRKPSEAPLIAYGQHYTGQLNNHKDDANYEGYRDVAIWRLPPVSTHDLLVIDWHELPYTHSSEFPICMELVQGADDFNWGSIMSSTAGSGYYFSCDEDGPTLFGVSGSGTARTSITVQSTDAGNTYLEFFSGARAENPADLETYPYDFSVEPPRHFLGLALTPKTKVHANGAISGAVTTADGLPAPDGLPFGMTVTWGDHGIATYAATTVGGRVTFPLALPESAYHEHAVFLVSHGADASYQAVSGRLAANVTPPVASAAEVACEKARQHTRTLSRQHRRLQRNAARASGPSRRRLRRRARHVGHQLRTARSRAGAACVGL